MSAARAFADTYVAIVNRGAYRELADLFALAAVMLAPGAQVFEGREAIRAFYDGFLTTIKPSIRIATYVEHDRDCVYELEAKIEGETEYALAAIDHATFDDTGLVARLAVYTK